MMKKLLYVLTFFLSVSVLLNGMEQQVKRQKIQEREESLKSAEILQPPPYITFISKDNKSVTVLRDQLAPFYGGVALATMQEAQAPTIKLDFNYQAMSLLPQILSTYVTAQAIKQNPKEFIKNILYIQVQPLNHTMIPILIEMEAFYDFINMPEAKNSIHEIVQEIRQKHFIATNQQIDIPGYDAFLGFSINQLQQQGKLSNAVVQYPDGRIHLNLSNFKIYSLDGIEALIAPTFYHLIVVIDVSNNIIENLSDSFVAFINQLPNLISFSLSTNKLKSLPDTFLTNAPALQEFLLTQNKLMQLPANFLANAPELILLDLADNRLTQLPHGFLISSPKLQQVWLHQNQLTQLPTNFLANSPGLQEVWLPQNKLTQLPANFLLNSPGLKELWLEQNKLTQLPANFLANAFVLKKLALNQNQLQQLPDSFLIKASLLKQLGLNQNQLVSLPANFLPNVPELKQLWLHENKLTQLPANFLRSATKLTTFTLNDNKLQSLPYGFMGANTNLELLILNGNPLYTNLMENGFAALPLHIQSAIKAGNKDYFNFLKQQEKEKSGGTKRPASALVQ